MINIKRYLPIGTIVVTKKSLKPLLIIGYFGMGERNVIYDYIATLSPEGIVADKTIYYFNHNDIDFVLSIGYIHNLYNEFNNRMLKGEML